MWFVAKASKRVGEMGRGVTIRRARIRRGRLVVGEMTGARSYVDELLGS